MALEHVAHGQTRFAMPGIAPDARGVVLGRHLLLTFPTLEGVVSFFRLYSAEASLDELMAGLEIIRVKTPLASRLLLLKMPALSSYTCDRAARLAKLVGGSAYTGTTKHFVKYRDDRSPYGYDAVDVRALPPNAELVVHGDEIDQAFLREGEVSFANLLFRLSVRRTPGAQHLRSDERTELTLAVERGLGDGVIRYLWRNHIEGSVGLVQASARGAFEHDRSSYLLMKVRDLPERIVDLFMATPGITVFRQVTSQAAVQVGFRHPIELSSCGSVFQQDAYHLFWAGDRVDIVPGPLELARLSDLTRIDLDLEQGKDPVATGLTPKDPIGVSLQIAPVIGSARRVGGTLVALADTERFKRLIFLLPPSVMRGHRVAVTDHGILVVGSEQIDVIPLGQLLSELAPGLFVPLGMDVVPRVQPEVLARALGHGAGVMTVFNHDGKPFQIPATALVPLERRALAKLEIDRAEVTDAAIGAAEDPSLVNDPVGGFALWGFAGAPEKKALKE